MIGAVKSLLSGVRELVRLTNQLHREWTHHYEASERDKRVDL